MEIITDRWTLELEQLLLDISIDAADNDKKYYFGGGFAIDLALGKLTRIHEDVDFHPLDIDTQWWKDWFVNRGFIISQDPDMLDFPNAFLPTNEKNDYYADVYPVKVGDNDEIMLLGADGKYGVWEGKSWERSKLVVYKGVPVYIEDPAQVIRQKLDHSKKYNVPLMAKHIHDIKNYEELLRN